MKIKTTPSHYHYDDHDSCAESKVPPVINTWNALFSANNVRLLTNVIRQNNDDTTNKDVEVRWTIDGTAYVNNIVDMVNNTFYWIYRNFRASPQGLEISLLPVNAGLYTDKRGKSFATAFRITSACGTNQILAGWAVYETLDVTPY